MDRDYDFTNLIVTSLYSIEIHRGIHFHLKLYIELFRDKRQWDNVTLNHS